MILLVAGEKGGTGKSTIAVNLAAFMKQEGRDVLLVDTDTQPSAAMWAATRGDSELAIAHPITCVQLKGKISQELYDLAGRCEILVADAGGRDSIELRFAAAVATQVIFPVRPGQFDSWTLGKLDKLVEEIKQIANPALKAKLVISCASPNMMIQEAQEMREYIKNEGYEHLSLAETVIHERISYRKAIRDGLGVVEWFDPKTRKRDQKAVEEIHALYQEIFTKELA